MTAGKSSLRIAVADQSYVGTVRRAFKEKAAEAGLSGEPLEKLSILSTELATNLAKYASAGGEIFFFDESTENITAVRLLAIDRGPGINNLDEALQDGFSSKDTLGGGMGALRRLSTSFEVSSVPGKGTVVQCLVSQSTQGRTKSNIRDKLPALEIGFISAPHPAETTCGDGVAAAVLGKMASILVTDGLGHGEGAAEASRRAIELFRQSAFDAPTSLVSRIHAELATTRGAALALVQIDLTSDRLTFVGVGNITARVYSRYSSVGCVSIQGIVGGPLGRLKPYEYEWSPGSRLLMYSDGILSAAKLGERTISSANMTAAEIYRDFCRLNDDATVVVVKGSS